MRGARCFSARPILSPCHRRVVPMRTNYTNLAFEGAGVRSIAQVGAIRGLKEVDGLLNGIRRVAGTSAGSLVALAMALQYTPEEIAELIRNFDFSEFLSAWDPIRLVTRYGLYDGDYAAETFADWVAGAPLGLSPDATFGDLDEAGRRWASGQPKEPRELHVFAANVSTNAAQRFSAACTPDVTLVEAARASTAIPLLLAAVKIDGSIYVDGGATYNYPVTAFDFQEPPCQMPSAVNGIGAYPEPDPATLGFYFEPLVEQSDLDWDDPIQFMRELIETTNQTAYAVIASETDIRTRSISIQTGGIKTTDFELSDRAKRTLWQNGLRAACAYFDVQVPEEAHGPGTEPGT